MDELSSLPEALVRSLKLLAEEYAHKAPTEVYRVFPEWRAELQGIYPGGVEPGMGPYSLVAIFGWVNFLGFVWLMYWSKCSIGLKMFAVSYDVGFMLDWWQWVFSALCIERTKERMQQLFC